jgi:hypothetical protein
MMKLGHMVGNDKLHARSIGPYSLITSNHLVGKAQLAVKGWVNWRCGRWKLLEPPKSFRKFSPLSPTMWSVELKLTSQLY